MKELIPLYLIPQYKVSLNMNNSHIRCPAQVDYTPATDSYEIAVNQDIARKMYEQSALEKYITFEDLLAGLLYHEVFHIEYKSFSVPYVVNNDFFHFIHNVLCDNQIEWHGTRDHPEAAKYIRFVLTALRKDTDFSTLKKNAVIQKQEYAAELERLKETFFFLVRFGVIIKNSDQEFVNFLLPLILSAQRNEPKNLMDAAQATYEYFFHVAKQYDINLSSIRTKTRAVTMKEMKSIDKVIGDSVSIIASSIRNLIDSLKKQKPNTLLLDGRDAGTNKTRVQIVEKDTQFYRQTVQKYGNKIKQIRAAFKRKLNEISAVPSFDGDLNWKRQQQAYIDSFSIEEGKNYQYYKKNRISIYNLILRDISSSTTYCKNEYAELTICLHAALQGLDGVVSGHIDFNSHANVIMNFGDSIREAAIYPIADGGTSFKEPFEEALKMNWRGKRNIINLITDGVSCEGYEESEQKLLARGIEIWYWDVSSPLFTAYRANPKLRKTSFETFDRDIANALLGIIK